MKLLFLVAVLAIFITGCQDQSSPENGPSVKANANLPATDFRTLDTAVFFSGLWVNEKYITLLKKTRTPKDIEVPENSCMVIPSRTLQSTSMIHGFHEGGDEVVVVKRGDVYELWDKALKGKHHLLTLLPENKLSIDNDTFVKIGENDPSAANQFNILEIVLFEGRYRDEDNSILELTRNGDIKGAKDFTKFEYVFDYDGPGMQVDEIFLSNNPTDMEKHGFKFKDDSLLLYKLKCTEFDSTAGECVALGLGEVYRRLVKVK